MNTLPLVSIVTSCYNHEKYLDDYFYGLMNQTYRNIEVILFDDGSSDGSWRKILSYGDKLKRRFSRVVLERHDNVGIFKELSSALRLVRGKFLFILDSDDYFLPEIVEKSVRYLLSRPEYGVVHSDTDHLYGDRMEIQHWKSVGKAIPQGDVFEDLLKYNFIKSSTACLRTNSVRRYVDFDRYASLGYLMEDYPMYLDLSRHTKFGYIDQSLARYRFLPESACHSNDPKKVFRFCKSYYQIRLDYIEKYSAPDEYRYRANRDYFVSLYYVGYDYRMRNECLKGYEWLVRHYPEKYSTPWHKIRAFCVGNNLLQGIVSKAQEWKFVYKGKQLIKSLRWDITT